MKTSEHREELKKLPQEIIKQQKREDRPQQRHTFEGPAEEFIQEDKNTSNQSPTHRNTSILNK